MWDATSGECTADLDHGEEAVMCCDFSQDASKLITGDTGGNVKVCIVLTVAIQLETFIG